MKIRHILGFIVGVLAGLTVICLLMPAGGVRVGNVNLEFPSLLTVLDAEKEEEAEEDTVPVLSPEELLEQRMEQLKTQKTDEFRQFASESPQRIFLPDGREDYLDAFFAALEQADSVPMRIVHLGDSQLEGDRISSSLREHYQATFGGSGVGLVPAMQTIPTYTLSQSISPGASGHFLAYGSADFRASHNRYGPMAQVNHVYAGTTLSFSPRAPKDYPHASTYGRLKVIASGEGGMSATAGGQTQSLRETRLNDDFVLLETTLPAGTQRASLSVHGSYDIYGIMFDGRSGVAFDNVPMRGCSGTIFTRISEQTLAPFFQRENVRLIILQYGGNSVPGATSSQSISNYMTSLRKQIRLFRRVAPDSRILFIGPADMATRLEGEMKTYPNLPEMVDSLREMSLQEGVAFWDMFSAMGGKGSIVKWYRARPQLAGGDFIHFTPTGARKMADMLYGTLQLYYRYYRLRTGQEDETAVQEMEFSDAVAPVDGEGTISLAELPAAQTDTLKALQALQALQASPPNPLPVMGGGVDSPEEGTSKGDSQVESSSGGDRQEKEASEGVKKETVSPENDDDDE